MINMIETRDYKAIYDYIDHKSNYMKHHLEANKDSKFLLAYKYITHSDLPSRGKRNGMNETLEKDYLYYLSIEQMVKLEAKQNKPFESAKQSNITISSNIYKELGIQQLQRREGHQTTQHNHIVLNDYANVFLVNDTMKYFNQKYTKEVLNKLNKNPNWINECKIELTNSDLTSIQVTHAIHGIGTANDKDFSKLRLNIFKNDILILLAETTKEGTKNLFIMLDRNPIFYTIIGLSNKQWQSYIEKQNSIQETKLKGFTITESEDVEKNRNQQNKWRDLLASEMMNYSTTEGEVFCPLTNIACDYESLGTIFRASHIKPFSACSTTEAYDINNGLLLCANADALFDKQLITIDENKNLVFSFLLKNNYKLQNQLLLNQPIFKFILNDERMKYMEFHRNLFNESELKRKHH